jgi:HlyD family secretion protein
MDKPRFGVARTKKIKRTIFAVIFLFGVSAATYGLSRLKPAVPSVDAGVLWPDKVKRGEMLHDIHGTGTLVPEDFRFVPANRDGVVDKINVRIGDKVTPNTVLAELSNPDLMQTLFDAQLAIKDAEYSLTILSAGVQTSILNQQAQVANIEAALQRAKLRADADEELAKDGLKSQLEIRLSRLEVQNLTEQRDREKERIAINARSSDAQIAAGEAKIHQLKESYAVRQRQIDQLKIKADTYGVLQELPIEIGKRVATGTTVAKITEPGRLKAQLKIPETQAKDLVLGQVASIDTRVGIVPGRIAHIDPAAIQGTVTVDVQLLGELPRGARPDQSVDGSIEIERLSNVLYVGRPGNGQANSTIQLFKVLPNNEMVRVLVKTGRLSVNSIEIVEGLQEGDEVILSDMSQWDAYDRLRRY